MILYNAREFGESIKTRAWTVEKETKKYYIFTNGWKVEKVAINHVDRYGDGWARTRKHAVTVFLKNINKEIEETEKELTELKESLNYNVVDD